MSSECLEQEKKHSEWNAMATVSHTYQISFVESHKKCQRNCFSIWRLLVPSSKHNFFTTEAWAVDEFLNKKYVFFPKTLSLTLIFFVYFLFFSRFLLAFSRLALIERYSVQFEWNTLNSHKSTKVAWYKWNIHKKS